MAQKPKKKDTWMPLYVGDYLADTMHLTARQHGAYLLLLMHAWRNDGRIPGAPEKIAAIAKLTATEWRRDEETIMAFFYPEIDGDGYGHKRVKAEIELTETRSKAGAAGAEKRWQNDSKPDGKTIAERCESDGISQSQSQSSGTVTSISSVANRARPIEKDFEPSAEAIAELRKGRPDLVGERYDQRMQDFRLWCREKAVTSHDPDATWLGFFRKTHAPPAPDASDPWAGVQI